MGFYDSGAPRRNSKGEVQFPLLERNEDTAGIRYLEHVPERLELGLNLQRNIPRIHQPHLVGIHRGIKDLVGERVHTEDKIGTGHSEVRIRHFHRYGTAVKPGGVHIHGKVPVAGRTAERDTNDK